MENEYKTGVYNISRTDFHGNVTCDEVGLIAADSEDDAVRAACRHFGDGHYLAIEMVFDSEADADEFFATTDVDCSAR